MVGERLHEAWKVLGQSNWGISAELRMLETVYLLAGQTFSES